MTSPLLLGRCVGCGETILRHRLPDGRQISCEQLARYDRWRRSFDQAPEAAPKAARQPQRQFQVIRGGRNRDEVI